VVSSTIIAVMVSPCAYCGSSSRLSPGQNWGDGIIEIIVTSGNELLAWNLNGTPVDYFPLRIPTVSGLYGPVLGDADGDGRTDLLAASPDGNICAMDRSGGLLEDFPLSAGTVLETSPLLEDLDRDGDMDLLAVTSGMLNVWDLGALVPPEGSAWPGFSHDSRHSGFNDIVYTPKPLSTELLPENLVYNYPNPAQGPSTTIRYRLESAAEVTIHIFDLAGELIIEMTGPGYAQTENEAVWDLGGITSGVYLARVCASSGGRKQIAIIKIAVAK